MKRMRVRKRSKRRKSSNCLKNQLPKLKGRKQTQGAKDTTKDFQREKTEAKGQSQRKCQGQKGEDTKGEERKEEQKGRHPCTFQKACCQRWYQRPSLQAPVWGARSERRGWEGWGRRRKRRRRSERTGWMRGSWWSQWKAFQRFWWKFNRLLKAGKVPAQIKEIWKKSETREEKTMLVDCLLQEELQDRLLGNAGRQSQLQKLAEETSDKSFGKDAQTSFPRAIMLHHYFHGDADAFNQALASGDITGVNQGGKVMYRFDTYEVEGPKNQTKESTNGWKHVYLLKQRNSNQYMRTVTVAAVDISIKASTPR